MPAPVAHGEDRLQTIVLPDEPADAPPQPGEVVALEEIVVTAQKREQSALDVPISMTVLSDSDLVDRHVVGIDDIAGQVPGLEFGELAASGQVSIRGVGFNLFSGIGENSTAIHADGLYLPRPSASTLVYEDLAGIEVLRGPQGTLYGRNATAGVINLISTPPPDAPRVSGGALLGSFDRRRISLSGGTGWLADDQLRVWLSGTQDERRDDLFVNVRFPGRDQGASRRRSLRFNADLDLGLALRAQLRSFWVDEAQNGYHVEAYRPPPDSVLAPPGTYTDDPYTHANNDKGFTRKTLVGGSLRLGYDLAARWRLTALTGYSDYVFDSDFADADGTANDLFTTDRLNHDRTLSQELFLGYSGDRLDWTVGLYYLDEAFDPITDALVDPAGLAGVAPALLAGLLPPGSAGLIDALQAGQASATPVQLRLNHMAQEDTTSIALYSDASYAVRDRLRVYAGLRYIDEQKDQLLTVRRIVDGTEQGAADCERQHNRLHATPFTGRLGAQFLAGHELMVFAQFARGFKAGGFAVAACDSSFAPERLDALEVGFKAMGLARRLRASGAAYHYDYANLQVEEVSLPDVFVNGAQARVDGAELELRWLPVAAWELSAHLGWLDAVYTRYENADNAASLQGSTVLAQSQDLSGKRLNRAPEWTVGAAVDYTRRALAGGQLALRVDAQYQGDYFLREFNTPTDRQAAHPMVNAFVSYGFAHSGFTLRGFVKNVTDEVVLGALFGVAGYKASTFNPPRTWGLGVDYAFGS